jgi:hypothetical protein
VQQTSSIGATRVQTSQQTRAGEAADATVVKLGELKSLAGQPIEIRSVDFSPVSSQIRKPQLVRHDQNDVRARRRYVTCLLAIQIVRNSQWDIQPLICLGESYPGDDE